MSAQKIQAALGLLQDDPDNELAWTTVTEAVTSQNSEPSQGELKSLLEAARRGYETRREWDAVARVLELETTLHAGTPVELAMQFELSRVLDEECFETARAEAAYRRLLQLRPGEPSAEEALERHAHARESWEELAEAAIGNASADPIQQSANLTTAAELIHRFGGDGEEQIERAVEHLEQALALSPKNERAAALLERTHRRRRSWEDAARIAELVATTSSNKAARIAALLRMARLSLRELGSEGRASAAYERVLDLHPGQPEAMAYLVDFFSKHEHWDHLVALYEDQLRGGGARPGEEAGIVFQIAMVHWRMRNDPRAAEPWFDRLRRLSPAHPAVLGFFREHCGTEEGRFRLMTVLSDAQRAMPDGPEKATLAAEIAKLAEEGANAQKAIEQYKTILRAEPDNEEARSALKRLYVQTEGWNALIELLRQELERAPAEDVATRASVLREIAAVYRDHIKSDTALVTVLSQLVQLDETDLESLRELLRAYEALGRFRDLLLHQGKLARALPLGEEKTTLLRSVARRWSEQFSNVQNATEAYEALLEVEPGDEEATTKLRELYLKRRAFAQLYTLYEREVGTKEGKDRDDLLCEMAKIAAERLDRGADAIRLYKEVLAADPSRTDVLDSLERQAEREKDFASLAEALERRCELATDDTARIAVLQKLGMVHLDKLGDAAASARAFRRVLEIQPGHHRALRVLRDAYLAGGDFDGLEELYASQNDWEGLAEVLSNAADRADDPELKIALSFRAARIFVEELGARERAFRSYERVLSVRADDLRAAEALVPIYENEEKWARLPALYEVLLAHASDAEKPALFEKLVVVTGKRLNQPEAALAWAKRAYDFAPSEATLEAFEAASRAAKSFDAYVETVEAMLAKKGKKKPKAAERRALRTKLGKLYAGELGRIDEAVATYRSLVEDDPGDGEAVEILDRLLRSTDRRDDLRWLFERRIENAAAEIQADLLAELAALEEDAFGEPDRAQALYRRALEAVPGHPGALRALSRLLLAVDDPASLAEVLEQHQDFVHGEAGASHRMALASLYLDSLERPGDALVAAARALDLVPGDRRALSVLERLLGIDETRARAAAFLEREYAASGDASREAQALSIQLETTRDPAQRLDLHLRLSELQEEKLHAVGEALETVLRGAAELPGDLTLWDRAARLAQRTSRPGDLAEALRLALDGSSKLSESVEIELCERAARLHDEQLGDPRAATPYLERVLAHNPADERAFARLKQILTSYEEWAKLEAVYAQAARATTDPSLRIELLHEVALVCEEITNEAEKALSHYEEIIALEPLHEAATRALDRLYTRLERWTKLEASLQQRLETAGPEETLAITLRLGQLALDRLDDAPGALAYFDEVLKLDAKHAEARAQMRRILELPDLRLRAAAVLEAAYDAHEDARELVEVLDIRLAACDESEQRELLHRIAELRDERLGDERGAFEAYARLVPMEAEDHALRQRMVDLGRRLALHARLSEVLERAADAAESADLASELLMDVARIQEDLLGDAGRAEQTYRRILGEDPSEAPLALPAARELERLYASSGKHAELAGILKLESELEDDVEARRLLLFRLSELYETQLDDPARAIATLCLRLEDDPSDDEALAALQSLYERTAAFRDLERTLHARAELSLDAGGRKALMIQRASLLMDRLADNEQALASWQTIHEEFGPDPETLAALSLLYEEAERWDDLVSTLEAELSLAEDDPSRLALLARLGDLRNRRLSDWAGALDALRQALTLDPSHAPSRAALGELLTLPEARRDAAELLHPLYEADGDHARLLGVVEIEIETEDDPLARLALLEQAVRLAEGALGDAGRAFEHAREALRHATSDDLPAWLERAENLAAATNRWAALVETLREIVSDVLDGERELEITLKIAQLAETKLQDDELARENYVRALDLHGDEPRALLALEALYERAGDTEALLGILGRRIDATFDDADRKPLLFRKARLLVEARGDREGAIASYETILEIDLDREAITALEDLYAKAERWGDLVALYERQLEGGEDGQASLHVRIAEIAQTHLSDLDRAFESIEEAQRLDPRNAEAIAFLEALLDDAEAEAEQRARAAELLEPLYLQRADYRRVIATIEARLSATEDAYERRPLLKRLAGLQETQAEDHAAALETTAQLFRDDIEDEETLRELERLSKMAGKEAKLAEILDGELSSRSIDDENTAALSRRTGELYVALGDVERALHFYRRALAFEPESRAVFEAIDAILDRASRHEERAELHREALEHRYEPAERVAALHELAAIERTALGDIDKAIATYRAVLEIDEGDPRAFDALTGLFRERESFADLAELYELRAEHAATGAEAAELHLLLARLYRDQLGELATALDWYERVVEEAPNHRAAISDLETLARGEDQAERAVEILRPLYEQADDWRRLITLNGQRFELSESDSEKLTILRETAKLWEDRGQDRARALDVLREALEIDPDDGEVRAEIERIVESLEAWGDLAAIYEGVVSRAEPLVQHEMLATLARVHDERRGDLRSALGCYQRIVALDDGDPDPLHAADELALLLGDWRALAEILSKKVTLSSDDVESAALHRRIAEIRRDMLEDPDGSIAAYEQALELDAEDANLVDRLIALYEPKNDASRLVSLYARRIELADASETELEYRLLLAAAARFENDLRDGREAIQQLSRALEIHPNEATILASLARLLRSEQLFPDLLENLKLQASLAETSTERARFRKEIGELYATELEDPTEAIATYRLVLDELPEDAEAASAIMAIGESREDLRLVVVETLEPVLRATSQWEPLSRALRLRLEAETDPLDRTRTRMSIAAIFDESLGRPGEALETLLGALSETPDDGALFAVLERLAAASNEWSRFADALEEQASSTFDGAIAKELWARLGALSASRLEDTDRAVVAYTKAIEQGGDDHEVLGHLDALYERQGKHEELADILERRIDIEAEANAQADMLTRLGRLQIEKLGDEAEGLVRLKQALERIPDHEGAREALEALAEDRDRFDEIAEILEEIYRQQGDSDRLTRLFEKRISFASDAGERLRMRLSLARHLEDRAADTKGAQKLLEDALVESGLDADVLAEIERLASIHDGWESAAKKLGAAIEASESLDTHAARDLHLKVASWYEDKLRDSAAAAAAYEKALAVDPDNLDILRSLERARRVEGRERELVLTLQKIAALENDGPTKRELLREAKALAKRIEDLPLCEEILRQLLQDDDADLWALEELTKLRDGLGDAEEVIALLLRRADLVDDSAAILLRHEAADIAEKRLEDPARAITLLEAILDIDAADERAAASLRRLYVETKRDADLGTLLSRLVRVAKDQRERNQLRLELAKIQAEKLDTPSDAIDTLRAALEEESDFGAAVVYLSSLYEAAHRNEDLAELLGSQIAKAKARGDGTTELSLNIRLAEMLETRIGDKKKAIAAYRAALACDSTHRGALEALARLLEEKDEIAEAAQILEISLGLVTGDELTKVALRLANLYAKLGFDERIRRTLEKGLEAAPRHAEIRRKLADLYERTAVWGSLAELLTEDAEASGDREEQLSLYRRAAELHLNKRADAEAAVTLLEKANALAPEDRELLLLLCDAYSASGRGKDAAAALEKIVTSFAGRRTKELATVHFRLSRAYRAEGDLARALTELDQAFRIDPSSIAILKELGALSLETGDLERAQRTYRALLLQKLDTTSPITKGEVFYYLGEISHRLGDKGKAVQMLERALENEGTLDKARALLADLKR